jgi:myo-inositol 2-dehydrogenase/D-chiro-inositol 1-dehydrogenase
MRSHASKGKEATMSGPAVRFGLIGYGAWGSCHAGAIAKTPGAELVAIAEQSADRRAAASEAHPQVAILDDYRRLIARDDVEIVVIVLPSHVHHEVATAALDAGKHLLLEKPMCLTIPECNDVLRLAAEKQRLLAIGHEFRLSSLWGKVKELVDQGLVGEPQYVLVELSRNPYRLGEDGWRYDIRRVGNWVLEEPIHFFDLARWYLHSAGEPESVYATANSRQVDHPELQDNFSAVVRFAGNAYAVVSQTLSAFEHHQTVKLTGTKGAVWASWSGAMDRTRHPSFFLKAFDGAKLEDVPVTKITGELFELEDQVAMMVAAMRSDGPVACPGEDGKWSVAMCLAAQQSVDTGQPVAIRQILA